MNDIYVIRFDNGEYWCGYDGTDTQIRKAMMYTSIKMCNQVANDIMLRKSGIIKKLGITSYKIIKIKIEIIGEVDD